MDPNHDQTTGFLELQKQTHEESNPQSQIDSNDADAPPIINKNYDLSVEILTDELINSTYESIVYNYSVLFLPKYLDALNKHMEEMPSISEQELIKFLTNLLLCILPIFSINNDARAEPISFFKSMSNILAIYLKLHSKLCSNVGSLSMIKLSQVYPTKLQQIEQYLKIFNNSIVLIASCESSTWLEVVLSDLILSFVKTLQAATSNQMMDNLIDLRIEIRNLAEIFSQFVLKISCQIKCKKYVPLEITKKIAFNAFATTLSIFRLENLKAEYWKLSNEQAGEPFHLEFFMRFLLSTCKIENDEIYKDSDLFSYASCYHNEEKGYSESDLEIKLETNIEIDNASYFLGFLDKMEQMIIDVILELPESKAIERLTSFIVPYIEGITRRDNSKAFMQVVSTRSKAQLYQILKNLLNIVDSQENYKTILRVVFNRLPQTYLSSLENKEEIAFLWDAIQEISKTRGECMRSLAAVQFENLKNVINETDLGDTKKAIFTPEESFDKIINLFEVIQEVYDTESLGIRGEGFDIAELVWNFIRHSHPTALLKYKAQVKQLIDAICKSQFLVYQLVLVEDIVEKIIHECFTNEKSQIFLHLMRRFFQKMKFNEENTDAELRKRVFLCLRRYCTSINTLFNKDDPADCLIAKKIFSFIVRFYIVLIEEEKISNFEDFFNVDVELCHNDSIFHTSRSNDSQMILLAFIQFYDAMLDAGKYEILLDKDVAKVLLKLTSTLLLVSPKLNSVLLERGCYDKLYHILSEAHLRLEFNTEDILAIINILFNLATKGYYHFVVEKPLSFDIARSVEDQMNKVIFSDYSPFWNYIAIKNRYFLSLLLKCLFEWNVAKGVKQFYLAVLESALTNSLANAAVCLQGDVFDRLMLYMKIELDHNNKRRLRDLIYSVLRVGVAVSHVKAFMRAFRYNYWESHEDYFRSLVSEFARAKFIKKMSDPENYYHSFLSSLHILKKVLKNSEDNENFTNFNGEHSGIIISNLNQSLRSTLTFLVTFRVENYISSDKRNIVSNYKILRDKITFEDNFNRNSFFTNMEGSVNLNYGYFDNSKNGLLLESRIGKLNRSSIMENNELYYPRLFSVVASHTTLEFYVGIQNRQPCLILDGKHRKKDGTVKEYREYFDFCPKENEWYTMFLIFTGKNTVKNISMALSVYYCYKSSKHILLTTNQMSRLNQ